MAEWISEVARSDGVVVQKLADEHWVVRRGQCTITRSPSGRPMLTAKQARRVADAAFPRADMDEPPEAA